MDITESDVITEEIGSPASSSSATQEFTFGSIPVANPVPSTVDSPVDSTFAEADILSPAISPAPIQFTDAESEDLANLDHLRAVTAQFEKGCVSFSDIVNGTGLSNAIVAACLKWLKDNNLMPMIAKNGDLYCSLDNVATLAEQLKRCVTCECRK